MLPLGSNIVAIKQNYEKIFLVFVKVGLFEEKNTFSQIGCGIFIFHLESQHVALLMLGDPSRSPHQN